MWGVISEDLWWPEFIFDGPMAFQDSMKKLKNIFEMAKPLTKKS